MKKAIVAIALAGFASTALAAVAGTVHDLSSAGPFNSFGGTLSSCQYCHAPHNVNTGVPGTPLWNRNTPTTSFVMYTSASITGVINTNAQGPNANSMTCLSCHDGATDMGATYTGARGFPATRTLTTANIPGTTANLGSDLRNDHPISVRYTPGTNYAAKNTLGTFVKLYTYSGFDYVECASCHDPHNFGAVANLQPFLRSGKDTLCTRCHLY